MKKSLLLTLLLLVHVCAAWAADKVITGNVIADDDKQPLIGVSVYVSADDLKKAGSSLMSLGVVTDIDGNFSITVPSGVKKLQLSYIGYTTQQIELKSGQTHYNVALQPSSTMLNDVVVTGYQTVERRKLTAAVAKIDISEGRIGTVKSIDQALSGRNCRSFGCFDFWSSRISGKDSYPRYFIAKRYTGPIVGARRYSTGRY